MAILQNVWGCEDGASGKLTDAPVGDGSDTGTNSTPDVEVVTDTDPDSNGDAHTDADTQMGLATVPGCDGATLLINPDNPSMGGPWPVGARTVMIGALRTEVWYPAMPGTDESLSAKVYDVREHLPDGEKDKIPDEYNPWQVCDCFSDIPLDHERGPYPVLLFFHGTAGFRTQSLTNMTHWASRGFVVIAADHPLLELKDVLLFKFGADLIGDAEQILDVLQQTGGELEFLRGYTDLGRIGVIGHSAGGGAAAKMGAHPGVQIVISMAAGGSSEVSAGTETVVMGATADQVVPYTQQLDGYAASPKPKRFVGLNNAGHLAFSDLCVLGADQGGLLDIAIRFGIDVNPLIANLAKDGCKEGQLPAAIGLDVINFATAAALEARLHCSEAAADWFTKLPLTYDSVVVNYNIDL